MKSPRFVFVSALSVLALAPVSSASELRAPRILFGSNAVQLDEARLTADVNGDGHVDLVVARFGPILGEDEEAVILLGDGTGGFTESNPVVLGPAGATNWSARALADVTGDGELDLIVAGAGVDVLQPGSWLVLVGDGNGAFLAPETLASAGPARDVATIDLDGDGTDEIVTLNAVGFTSGTVETWRHEPGGFVSQGALALPEPCETLAVADVAGDGSPEAFAAPRQSTLLYEVALPAGAAPTLTGTLPLGVAAPSDRRVIAGDVDTDGDVDLVVTDVGFVPGHTSSQTRVEVLRGDGTGALVLEPKQPVIGTDAHDPVLVDWNGDGRPELLLQEVVSLGASDASLYHLVDLEPSGARLAATILSPPSYFESGPPIVPADLNGDGHLDLVSPNAAYFGRSRFENFPIAAPGLAQNFNQRAALDLEGDGDIDIVAGDNVLFRNDGSGTLTQEPIVANVPPDEKFGVTTAAGDFDGDGVRDLLAWHGTFNGSFFVFDGTHLLAGSPDGTFSDAGQASAGLVGSSGTGLRHGAPDMDGDGDGDVISYDGWSENDGGGSFHTFHADFDNVMAVADLDGDGDPDVVDYANVPFSKRYVLHRNDGTGEFTTETLLDDVDGAACLTAVADLDGDGDLDLALTSANLPLGAAGMYVFENVGGAFQGPFLFAGPTSGQVVPTDLDGDGDLDLLAFEGVGLGEAPRTIVAWLQSAPLTFDETVRYYGPGALNAFDDDGDGDLDLAGYDRIENALFDGDEDGRVRQFGEGFADPGIAVPVLGAQGPLRPTSTTAELRLVQGPPLGVLVLFLSASSTETAVDGVPIWVGAPILSVTRLLVGTPGVPGSSAFTFPLASALPDLAGLALFHQAFVVDPAAPTGISATSGLELVYGL